MGTYLKGALPRVLLPLSALLVVLLVSAAAWRPWILWPLQGLAVGVLAAAAGWSLDEPSAGVVDAAPRGLRWRTAVRAVPLAGLVALWCAVVLAAGDRLFGHPVEVAVQGVAGVCLAAAWVTWRRARGDATPGQRLAAAVIPLTAAWALLRPLERQLPLFPFGPAGRGDWGTSLIGWVLAGCAGVALTALVLALDGRPPALRSRPHGS
ncbi:MAG: hypothetical protein ACI379_03935 [Nocardioides sp.]|uniref:hypothetical protein n=1 Tax=Nocardioides sp. TaxID=35761 RepID=UPI003F074B68